MSQKNIAAQSSDAAATAQFVKMTATPIPKLVIRLAIPTIVSMLVSAVYNMADTFFVSQLGTSASAAVGVVFSLMAIIQAIGFTLGMGSGSIVSRRLGMRDDEAASRYASSAFFTSLFCGLLISIVGLLFCEPLMYTLGSTETILPYSVGYARYILIGAPIMCSSFVMNNILRAEGKAAKSMIGLMTGGILNMALDPLFIFTFGLGISGAAIATVISQFVSFCILLSFFLRHESASRLSIRKMSRKASEYLEILRIGFPSLCRQGLASIATVMLNVNAALYGDAAVAAMSICGRLFMFVMSAMLGVGQGFQPVSGYNYGARRYDRVKQAYWFTVKTALVFMGTLTIVCFILAPDLIRIFRDDADVIQIGTMAVRFQAIAMLFQPISVSTNMLLQSTGKSLEATFLACLRQGIYFIPLIWLFTGMFGLTGVEMTQPVCDLLTLATSIPFIIRFFKKLPAVKPELVAEHAEIARANGVIV